MKNHYTFVKMFFAVALIASNLFCSAQQLEYLDANNVRAGFSIGGNLFTVFDSALAQTLPGHNGFALYDAPKNFGTKPVFTAALWMTGLDSSIGQPHCAAQRYLEGGHDYYDGPIVSNYDATYDAFYSRVFKITKAQIDHHKALLFPISSLLVDSALLKWPAKGNPFVVSAYNVSINSPLAPFTDVDADGIYDATKGDYPAICGDEGVFFVFNDERGYHYETQTPYKLGFEIRGLAEMFVDTSSQNNLFEKRAINNTIFVSYEIENKSQQGYSDFYLGMFEDPDLGSFANDRVGCDTIQDLMFVYNEGADNDFNGAVGFSPFKAAHDVQFLNKELSTFGYFINSGSVQQADPGSCIQFSNYLQGFWRDGTPFTLGGTGYNSSNTLTHVLFPGDPNNPNDWTDYSSGQPAGDRRMFGSIGPTTFARGEIKRFDFAFTTSYDSTATYLTIVDTMKRDADIIQQFYDNQILPCRSQIIAAGVGKINKDELAISVYPNPSSSQLIIETATKIDLIQLHDVQGRLVMSKTPDAKKLSIDVSLLAHGVYILRIKSEGKTVVKKLVVE